MCKVCEDYKENDNAIQAVRNLFEVKERIGVEHTREVMAQIAINWSYDEDDVDGRIIKALNEFTAPEEPEVIDRSQL